MLSLESRPRADLSGDFKKIKKKISTIHQNVLFGVFCLIFILASFLQTSKSVHAEVIRINSIPNIDCNMVCSAYDADCLGIANTDYNYNSYYCQGVGGNKCENIGGTCSSVMWTGGTNCSDASSSAECLSSPFRESSWTNCLCDIVATSTPTATGTHDLTEAIPIDYNINVITGIAQTYDQSSTNTPAFTTLYAFNSPMILIIFLFMLMALILAVIAMYFKNKKIKDD
jgi:hypothetical protein